MPFVVGLTGGIGSGKSSVAQRFARLGAQVIDADAIAHELTEAGQPLVRTLAELFGPGILAAEGRLDRAGLRRLVFADRMQRQKLEQVLHPEIRRTIGERILSSTGPYVLLVVPLLVEKGGYDEVIDRVLVVDSPEDLQVERVMRRSRLQRDEVLAIMRTQSTRAQRLARADDVLVNDGSLEGLQPAIEALHEQYLRLASAR